MNMESNKILAAFLVAGIIAMTTGFVSHLAYHKEPLAEDAFKIEVADAGTAVTAGAAAPQVAEPIDALIAAADIAQGEKLAKMCAACHTFDAGGANRVGPNLAGILGAGKAKVAGFAYSDAMKAKGGSWDVAELNEFLWNPKKTVPGTKMAFAGLKKPEDRAAVVKFLQSK